MQKDKFKELMEFFNFMDNAPFYLAVIIYCLVVFFFVCAYRGGLL